MLTEVLVLPELQRREASGEVVQRRGGGNSRRGRPGCSFERPTPAASTGSRCDGVQRVREAWKHASGMESRGRRCTPLMGPGEIPERVWSKGMGRRLVMLLVPRRSSCSSSQRLGDSGVVRA
jgi:hypothetical protein